MKCLRGTGIIVELGRFKAKNVFCTNCGSYPVVNEEKETDVAIAARLFEICAANNAETIILITGDTDLAPAIRTCKRLYPNKYIFFAFSYKRTHLELVGIALESFSIKLLSYLRHQFPDPLILSDGTSISKPSTWWSGSCRKLVMHRGRHTKGVVKYPEGMKPAGCLSRFAKQYT